MFTSLIALLFSLCSSADVTLMIFAWMCNIDIHLKKYRGIEWFVFENPQIPRYLYKTTWIIQIWNSFQVLIFVDEWKRFKVRIHTTRLFYFRNLCYKYSGDGAYPQNDALSWGCEIFGMQIFGLKKGKGTLIFPFSYFYRFECFIHT